MKAEVKSMSQQAIVLDTIKKTKGKGGMTSAQIQLAEAQSEDYAEMKKELQEFKSEVKAEFGEVKKDVSNVMNGLAEIKGSLNILLNSKKLTDNKYFWICIIITMMLLAGVTHISELTALFGG